MSQPNVIETRQIRKAYSMGDNVIWALKGVDVSMKAGEF